MTVCAKCGVDNPAGSRFCAGCGTPVPTVQRCASCGTESPPGSKFCKGCGAVLQASFQTPGQPPLQPPLEPPVQRVGMGGGYAGGGYAGGGVGVGVGQGAGAARRPAAASESLSRLKMLLLVAIGLYAVGLYFNFTGLSQLNQARQFYGPVIDTTQVWFFILIDAGMAALSALALSGIAKGNLKTAKGATIGNAVVGAIALLLTFKSGIVSIALNGGLAVSGIWGRLLISKEEHPLV